MTRCFREACGKARIIRMVMSCQCRCEQVTELKTLEQQAETLEAQNAQLQRELLEKEAEILRTQQAAAASSRTDSEGSSKPQKSAAAKKAELNQLVQKWLDTVPSIPLFFPNNHSGTFVSLCPSGLRRLAPSLPLQLTMDVTTASLQATATAPNTMQFTCLHQNEGFKLYFRHQNACCTSLFPTIQGQVYPWNAGSGGCLAICNAFVSGGGDPAALQDANDG